MMIAFKNLFQTPLGLNGHVEGKPVHRVAAMGRPVAIDPTPESEQQMRFYLEAGMAVASPAIAPELTGDIEIDGLAQVGATLRLIPGTWVANPEPTFAFQWYQGPDDALVEIDGATSPTLQVTEDLLGAPLRCRLTVTNGVCLDPTTITSQPSDPVVAAEKADA